MTYFMNDSRKFWDAFLASHQAPVPKMGAEGVRTHKPMGTSIPLALFEKENTMYVGQVFSTGNAEINSLRAGSKLTVVGQGQVRVDFIAPEPWTPKPGDRIKTKHGKATVVRMTTRDGLSEEIPAEGEVLYIADGTNVVRIADVTNVSKASY